MTTSNGLMFQKPAHKVTLKDMSQEVYKVLHTAREQCHIFNHAKTYSTSYSQYTYGFTVSKTEVYFTKCNLKRLMTVCHNYP